MEFVFPSAPLLPSHLVERIFINANRHHDLRSLRMVSNTWREFIDCQMLNRPVVAKKLNDDLMLRGWRCERRRVTLVCRGAVACETVFGNCIILQDVLGGILQIFRENGDYVGYMRKVPFLINFLEVNGRFYSISRGGYDDYHLYSMTYELIGEHLQPLAFRDIENRVIIGLEQVDKHRVYLISIDIKNNLLFLYNIVDDSEFSKNISSVGEWINARSCCRKSVMEKKKGKFMVIYWHLNHFLHLQLIDCVKGVEIKTWDYTTASRYPPRLEVTERYTCFIFNCPANMKRKTAYFFDNETGSMICSFSSLACLTSVYDALFAGDLLLWRNLNYGNSNNNNDDDNNNTVISVFHPWECKLKTICHNTSDIIFLSKAIADNYAIIASDDGTIEIMDLSNRTSVAVEELEKGQIWQISSRRFFQKKQDSIDIITFPHTYD